MPDSTIPNNKQDPAPASGVQMSTGSVRTLGTYFVLLGFTLLYLAFVIWPPDYHALPASGSSEDDKDRNPLSPITFVDFRPSPPPAGTLRGTAGTPLPTSAISPVKEPGDGGRSFVIRLDVTYDQRLFLLVLILGALGSYIHAVMSFADYAGNRRLVQSWLWWYLLRPFAGAPIALVLYFAVRAGFLTPSASGGDVSRFGIAALSMLSGMFSMKAADKLEEVFDILFKTLEKRKDSLVNTAPILSAVIPMNVKVGSGAQKIVLEGSHFSTKAVILFGTSERTSNVASSGRLSFDLSADDTRSAGVIKLAVKNPPPNGGTSNSLSLTIEA